MLKFISFSSGSCGNCSLLSNGKDSLLIDAGVGIRTMKQRFREFGINIGTIRGILITHAHADHICAAGQLSKSYKLPVYATQAVHACMLGNYHIPCKVEEERRVIINKDEEFHIVDFRITAFDLPHDTENTGYSISTDDGVFTLMTDVGAITENVCRYIQASNYIVIEADYDEYMLEHGRYHVTLKERIRNGTGHLSNLQCAEALTANYHQGLRNVWLCHRSAENNTEDLCLNTVKELFEQKGIIPGRDFTLEVLKRGTPMGPWTLTKDNRPPVVFFDLDGTLLDTEAQYTEFWSAIGRQYRPDLPDFNNKIKGTTLTQIFELYIPVQYRHEITEALDRWEQEMAYPFVEGAEEFVRWLQSLGIKTAVVTSSNLKKMQNVMKAIPAFSSLFDLVLTSEDFSRSKPYPDCYLAASKRFNVSPDKCIVFEDAVNGLQAAREAGTYVIGITTTHSVSSIEHLCDEVIDSWKQAYSIINNKIQVL